jgi:hypothetical protein
MAVPKQALRKIRPSRNEVQASSQAKTLAASIPPATKTSPPPKPARTLAVFNYDACSIFIGVKLSAFVCTSIISWAQGASKLINSLS